MCYKMGEEEYAFPWKYLEADGFNLENMVVSVCFEKFEKKTGLPVAGTQVFKKTGEFQDYL